MAKYRQKSLGQVEAIQWFEKDHLARSHPWPGVDERPHPITGVRARCWQDGGDTGVSYEVPANGGIAMVQDGDWIVTAADGRRFVHTPDAFAEAFEPDDKPTAIATLLKQIGDPAKCRGCGRDIYLVTTKNGKKAPITPEGINHFADCPKAQSFRGGRE